MDAISCAKSATPRLSDDMHTVAATRVQTPRHQRAAEGVEGGAVDMLRTCAYPLHMSRMIQIRNVPDDVHRKLKVRAAQEGVTLSELLAREARRLAAQPSMSQMLARIASREPVKLKTPSSRLIRELRDSC